VALVYAFAADKISTELIDNRKRELTDLVSEAAKTFGFQSKTTLTNAFDVSVGLLSLAIVNGTAGETLPDQWAHLLVTRSWKALAKDSIALVRTITEQDAAHDYLFENDRDPRVLRDHLRDFAVARDPRHQWIGYDAFVRYREERLHLQRTNTLIRWLIKTVVKRPLYWMKDPIEGPTCAEEALNTILFRVATGLGFGQKDIILGEPEFRQIRTKYDENPAEFLELGHQRYESLASTVPANLKGAMDKKWFHKRLGKGPPKLKKWSDDMPGITGFYYYQAFA
jgi:hypothetical protein